MFDPPPLVRRGYSEQRFAMPPLMSSRMISHRCKTPQCVTFTKIIKTEEKGPSNSKLVIHSVASNDAKDSKKWANPLYSPSCLWSLSPVALKNMFQEVDTNHDGSLTVKELNGYAKTFYAKHAQALVDECGMTKEEIETHILHGRPLRDHLLSLVKSLQGLDTDGDNLISMKEFLTQWNQIANKTFSQDGMCSVM